MPLRYLEGVVTLELDEARCNGCRTCTEVCPHAVLGMEDGRARIVDRDACIECGACAVNCPTGAVSVQAGVGCANALIRGKLGRRGGACCSSDETPGGASGGSSCCGR